MCGMETACHRKNCRRLEAETPCPRRREIAAARRQGEPPSGGGENAVPTAEGLPVFTGGNKRGQDTKYGFLSPLDSPHLPLR